MSAHRVFIRYAGRASRRLALIIALAAALVAATAGVAFAFWSTNGSGSGSATAGTMTINVTALQTADTNQSALLPGGTGDVILRVNNPNSFSIHITSVAGNGTPIASNGCTPTGVTFTAPTDYTSTQFTLAAGSNLITLAGAANMSTASASSCQGAIFSIPVTVTAQR
ncbi:MAG: hypothetical protein JWO57_2349 [Pseudonocardiales bacterium]|nr:hypothetical protein [Pseudonocardiales bacterium]